MTKDLDICGLNQTKTQDIRFSYNVGMGLMDIQTKQKKLRSCVCLS